MTNTRNAPRAPTNMKRCYEIIDILVNKFPQRYHKSYQHLKDLLNKCNKDFLKKFVNEIIFQYPYSAHNPENFPTLDYDAFLGEINDDFYRTLAKFLFGKTFLFLGQMEIGFKHLFSFARDARHTKNNFLKGLVGYVLNLADIILSCEKYSSLYDKYIDVIDDIVSDETLSAFDINSLKQKNVHQKYDFLIRDIAQVSLVDFIFQIINFPNIAEDGYKSITGLENATTPYQALAKLEDASTEILKDNPKLRLLLLEAKLFFIWKKNKKEANNLFNDLLDTMEGDYVEYFAPELFTIWKYRELINDLNEKTFINLINARIIDVLNLSFLLPAFVGQEIFNEFFLHYIAFILKMGIVPPTYLTCLIAGPLFINDFQDNEVINFLIGFLYYNNFKYADAIKFFEKTVTIRPDFFITYPLLSRAFYMNKVRNCKKVIEYAELALNFTKKKEYFEFAVSASLLCSDFRKLTELLKQAIKNNKATEKVVELYNILANEKEINEKKYEELSKYFISVFLGTLSKS